jgi:hypothetical protein
VVDQPGEVRCAHGRFLQRCERPPVERHAQIPGEGRLDRQPRQLVPELDAVVLGAQHPRADAFVEAVERALGEGLEQPHFGALGDDGDRVEHRSGRGSETRRAGQDGVAHRHRHALGLRCEGLGDEERVAGGALVQLRGIGSGCRRQRGDRGRGQAGELQPGDGSDPRKLAEHDPQRVGAGHLLVSVAGDHQRRHLVDAAGEEPHDVERGLVGPVDVLEHEHRRRRRAELGEHRRRDVVRHRPLLDAPPELPVGHPRDVEERPERPWREERIARRPQNPGLRAAVRAEPAKQGRLADAGLTLDEDDLATRAGPHGGEAGTEHHELFRTLE